MTARVVELQLPAADAWLRVIAAASTTGRIEETHEAARYLVMKSRYGLNPVRLRVAVLSGAVDGTARIEIDGRGQDVWGVASRKVIDKFCASL